VRALYVSPLRYGANPSVDAFGHGLDDRLAGHGIEMRVLTADFFGPGWPDTLEDAVLAGVDAGVDAIVPYVIHPESPAKAAAAALARGIPVVTVERPQFPVSASVVLPNFNHGVYMIEHLAALLPTGADVAVIGGPRSIDDSELLCGITHGMATTGLRLVNDPTSPRYRNDTDDAAGGYLAAQNVLADHPRLAGLVPYNDETMLGTLEALREAGRLGEAVTVSRNGTPLGVRAVRDGVHAGTWDLDAIGLGQAVADLVARATVGGEDLDGLCVAGPIGRMITPERATRWRPYEQRVAWHPFHEGLG
jgi:ABC-type sugar transport system substrate-binding protein